MKVLPEFARRGFLQEKINELRPNDVELFLAEKLRYGLHSDRSSVPSTATEENAAYTRGILRSSGEKQNLGAELSQIKPFGISLAVL